jgi:hypothetical protein
MQSEILESEETLVFDQHPLQFYRVLENNTLYSKITMQEMKTIRKTFQKK